MSFPFAAKSNKVPAVVHQELIDDLRLPWFLRSETNVFVANVGAKALLAVLDSEVPAGKVELVGRNSTKRLRLLQCGRDSMEQQRRG